MAERCGNQSICGFFKKYSEIEKTANYSFVKSFCRGSRQSACAREVYRKTYNAAPPDELMPCGSMVA